MRLNDRSDGSIKTLLILVLLVANIAAALPNNCVLPLLPGFACHAFDLLNPSCAQ